MEYRPGLRDRRGFQAGLDRASLGAADKLQALFLPEVEVAVTLVIAVHDPGQAVILGLYLDPPDNALVLAVDEKTCIQALDRTQPLLPLQPDRPRR